MCIMAFGPVMLQYNCNPCYCNLNRTQVSVGQGYLGKHTYIDNLLTYDAWKHFVAGKAHGINAKVEAPTLCLHLFPAVANQAWPATLPCELDSWVH